MRAGGRFWPRGETRRRGGVACRGRRCLGVAGQADRCAWVLGPESLVGGVRKAGRLGWVRRGEVSLLGSLLVWCCRQLASHSLNLGLPPRSGACCWWVTGREADVHGWVLVQVRQVWCGLLWRCVMVAHDHRFLFGPRLLDLTGMRRCAGGGELLLLHAACGEDLGCRVGQGLTGCAQTRAGPARLTVLSQAWCVGSQTGRKFDGHTTRDNLCVSLSDGSPRGARQAPFLQEFAPGSGGVWSCHARCLTHQSCSVGVWCARCRAPVQV